jgi:hypothetical protein
MLQTATVLSHILLGTDRGAFLRQVNQHVTEVTPRVPLEHTTA